MTPPIRPQVLKLQVPAAHISLMFRAHPKANHIRGSRSLHDYTDASIDDEFFILVASTMSATFRLSIFKNIHIVKRHDNDLLQKK